MMDKIICLLFRHDWQWRKSLPFERTGTNKDLALIPVKCNRCGHIPMGDEVSRLAKYEGHNA